MMELGAIKNLIKDVSRKGFFNLLSANVLIQIVSFASQLFVAGILSPDDLGRIKILQTWLNLLSILGSMGFINSTLKLCSEKRSKAEINRLFKSALIFSLITTFITYGIVLVLNNFGVISKDVAIRAIIPLALLPIISNTLFSVYVRFYQAQKEIKFISNLTSINKTLAVVLIVIATYLWGIKGYYIGLNIAAATLLLAIFWITRKKTEIPKFNYEQQKTDLTTHWHYAKPSLFSSFLADMLAYVDILFLNFFLINNMTQVGFYGFAVTLTVALRMIPSTIQQITIPYFSNIADNMQQFNVAYRKYSRLLILIVIGTLILALALAPSIIHFLFKGKYDPSMQYFIPLAIGWSIRQYNQIQAAALFGIGAIHKTALSRFISLLFNIVVIYLAFYFWGIMGIAYASIVCATFEVSIMAIFVKKSLVK